MLPSSRSSVSTRTRRRLRSPSSVGRKLSHVSQRRMNLVYLSECESLGNELSKKLMLFKTWFLNSSSLKKKIKKLVNS